VSAKRARLPVAFADLAKPARYKLYYGGRGSGKSTSFATVLIARAAERPIRILCCREFMSSIRDSVHQLLCDRIDALEVADQFIVEKTSIRHKNGSEFIFAGLRHNVTRIKGLENITIAWMEEAATISAYSLSILVPTIRAPNSEIWASWNPELETDPIWDYVLNPRPDSIVRLVTFDDNQYFPEVLRLEMMDLKNRDYDQYQHVYGGKPRQTLVGAIYAQQLRDAVEAGRIGSVPYDPLKGVHVAFDLGFRDHTAAWMFQTVGGEIHLIDHMEGAGEAIGAYLKRLQERPYVIDTIHLPPDSKAKELGTGKSIEEIVRAAGFRVLIVPALTVEDGINAVRTMFSSLWFDQTHCADGINALRRYRYEVDDNGAFSNRPLHDEASHSADALRYAAVAMTGKRQASYQYRDPRPHVKPLERRGNAGTGWLRG
jgi:phage terminase large subunit